MMAHSHQESLLCLVEYHLTSYRQILDTKQSYARDVAKHPLKQEHMSSALRKASKALIQLKTGQWQTRTRPDAAPPRADRHAFALYTNHGATDPRNPLCSPLYANVQGLPPTLLLVGTEEAQLNDSTRMADRLKAAGVEVKLEIWPGMWHDFIGSPDVIPEVRLATQHKDV